MNVLSMGTPVSEADVQKLERSIGKVLPADYRNFLLTYNARQIMPCVLPTPQLARSEKVVLHQLTCFCPKTTADFQYRMATYKGRIPAMMLPLGSDPGGNLFLLDLRIGGTEKIYFWEREFSADEDEEPSMQNMTVVADNFTDLLSKLVQD